MHEALLSRPTLFHLQAHTICKVRTRDLKFKLAIPSEFPATSNENQKTANASSYIFFSSKHWSTAFAVDFRNFDCAISCCTHCDYVIKMLANVMHVFASYSYTIRLLLFRCHLFALFLYICHTTTTIVIPANSTLNSCQL